MKKALSLFMVANVIVFMVLAVFLLAFHSAAVSEPKPIYGDWAYIVGRICSSNDTVSYLTNHRIVNGNRTCIRDENISCVQCFDSNFERTPLKVLRNRYYNDLEILCSTLTININVTEKIRFSLGARARAYRGYQVETDYIIEKWSINASCFEGVFSWVNKRKLPKRMFEEWSESYMGIYYTGSYSSTPIIFWEGNESVEFEYTEIWRYKPITHYDKTTIEHGRAGFNRTVTITIATIVCDFLISAVIVGTRKNGGEP